MATMQTYTCPWCGTHYTEHRANCTNCGGALPVRTALTAGPLPPPPPRAVPSEFVRRVRYANRVYTVLGQVFSGLGVALGVIFLAVGAVTPVVVMLVLGVVFFAVFGGIGVAFLTYSRRKISRQLAAITQGVATGGVIEDVFVDMSVRVNHRSPTKVEYSFSVGGVRWTGSAHAWQPDPEMVRGAPVHVVYVVDNPGQSSLFPPVA
ncbi:MAG: DUF3592 domain-containing protein [Anaerolineales bacterium]|nr:DUF3592 domain-containing protein [Anaerolineales bacterium]